MLRAADAEPAHLTIGYVNGAAAKLLGATAAGDLLGLRFLDVMPMAARPELTERLRGVMRGESLHDFRVTGVQGVTDPCEPGRAFAIQAVGMTLMGRLAIQVSLLDTTPPVEPRAALRVSDDVFRLSFDGALVSMALTSLEPAIRGRIARVNAALCDLLGYDEAALLEMTFERITHHDDVDAVAALDEGMASGWVTSWRGERRFRHADGHDVWALVSTAVVGDRDGRPAYAVSQIEDITARKEAEAKLSHQALHDALTGLPNRHLLHDHLTRALARSHRIGGSVGVLFLDLDNFKAINDSLGHSAGDDLLLQVGRRLSGALRESDTAARLGGDEFVLVCEDLTDPEEIHPVADRLLGVLEEEMIVRGHVVSVSASIGVAVGGPGATADELLRDADAAMYRAKQLGKGRWELADEELQAAAARRVDVESGLRRALPSVRTRGELVLHYQPTVDLRSGRMVGVEALLRWRHPVRGLLLPQEFLDVAEESQLIVPIGAWVLDEACRVAAGWLERFGDRAPAVAVNISSRQLGRNELIGRVRDVLRDTGLPPDRLHLEITERQVIDVAGSIALELRALSRLGIRLAVDDFGTGYAGFTYLRHLPVSTLKVDRSFVAGLGSDRTDTAITTSVVALGQTLGLGVIAEGVETPAQRRILLDLGCPVGQGWLWHRAVPAEEIDALLEGSGFVQPK